MASEIVALTAGFGDCGLTPGNKAFALEIGHVWRTYRISLEVVIEISPGKWKLSN